MRTAPGDHHIQTSDDHRYNGERRYDAYQDEVDNIIDELENVARLAPVVVLWLTRIAARHNAAGTGIAITISAVATVAVTVSITTTVAIIAITVAVTTTVIIAITVIITVIIVII